MSSVHTVENAAENSPRKNRYHTGLLIAYRLDVLEEDTLRSIPSSTLCDWRKRDITGIVGFNPDDPWLRELDVIGKFHRRRFLKRVVIALVRVSDFHAALLDGLRGHKRELRERREQIVALVSRIAPVIRLDRACRLMRITVQRYYRWKSEIACSTSAIGLCRKLHPGQLTQDEQRTVAEYVRKPEIAIVTTRNAFRGHKVLIKENVRGQA